MRSKTEAGARNNVELAPEVRALDLRQSVARILLFQPLHRKPQIVPRRPIIFNFSGLRCDGERSIYEPLNWKKFDQTALTAAIILLVVCPLVYFSFAVCCRCRTRKVETDDLNRRASAMSIELVRRRSSINYDNLPVNRV